MKLLTEITKVFFRTAFAYGLCLLFANEFNPLEWSTTIKVIFVIILILLLSQD